MGQPKGFEPEENSKVCKLYRSWNHHFDEAIRSYSFIKNKDELCVYKKVSGSELTFIVLYVNDILLIGNDVGMFTYVKVWLLKTFLMKDLGKVTYILRIRVYRDRSKRIISLSQSFSLEKGVEEVQHARFQEGIVTM